MKRRRGAGDVWAACLAVLLGAVGLSGAQEPTSSPPGIDGGRIAALLEDLKEAGEATSSSRKRRAYKGVVRDGNALIESSPSASNRWRVLEIVLQSQKRLLIVENSNGNREALLETCAKLAKAPDAVADLRLEADLLLSERELSLRNADVTERARALAELIARYRDTPGEARSLMMASQIAPKLEAFDLETQVLRAMQERFSDHHGVIEFRRKSLAAGRIEALFRGSFTRADGTSLSFPVDRMGHPCLMVFWSGKTSGFEVALKQINSYQELYPDRFDFYSFNLDGLDDAGESLLRTLGLPWNAMRLPGGINSQTFRTYGRREPVSILVNAYGYTLLTPTHNYGRGQDGSLNPYKFDDVRITSERYLAQLQSLFIGDFLAGDAGGSGSDELADSLRAIQECFVAAPLRYRLTRRAALANYQEAVQRCNEAIAQFPQAPDLWRVRNRRIIALLGMWKLSGEPKHLARAAEESRDLLSRSLPAGADVAARFCLAKEALRTGDTDAKWVLSGLLEATGGEEAPGAALAAACILALDANSRALHNHYRGLLLETHADNPVLWPVVTFLRDRYHTMDLLKVKLSRPERRIRIRYGDLVAPRAHAINHALDPMTRRLPDITLKTLDGKTLTLPEKTGDKLTMLLFIEPPADPEADFPVVRDKQGRPTKNDPLRNVMGYALEMADRHVHKEVELVAAFLSDDANHVRTLMAKNQWPCRPALVPGGLHNPLVRQLGILSADRIPNVFLIRRDGSIAWHTSGFVYKSDFGYPFAIRLAMKVHIEVCDTQLAFKALAKGDFQEAARVFSGPFLPEKDERYRWRAPRFHGRALANMGLNEWDTALSDIETAIEAHRKEFDHAQHQTCESMVFLQRTQVAILEKLGRLAEAQAVDPGAANLPATRPTTPYELFHGKLEELRHERALPKDEPGSE